MITGVSEHVEAWLEDECDRTELDFILAEQEPLTDGEISELQAQAQEPINNISQLPAEEQPIEEEADAEY